MNFLNVPGRPVLPAVLCWHIPVVLVAKPTLIREQTGKSCAVTELAIADVLAADAEASPE